MLNFIEKRPKNTKNPYLLIMLHGWGSNKEDLMALSDAFGNELDNIHYISVEAPFKCDSGKGYQWFSLIDTSPASVMLTIKDNYKILENFIEEQSKRLNIDYDHIFLLGFSQGASMVLHTGVRLAKKLAGVIVLSGVLPETPQTLKNNLKTKQKILMIHGTDDKVVPYEYFLYGEKILKMLDFDLKTKTINGMSHTINNEEEKVIIDFIKSICIL